MKKLLDKILQRINASTRFAIMGLYRITLLITSICLWKIVNPFSEITSLLSLSAVASFIAILVLFLILHFLVNCILIALMQVIYPNEMAEITAKRLAKDEANPIEQDVRDAMDDLIYSLEGKGR